MVRELERQRQGIFPESAPAANPVFFRTYSRRTDAGLRENWSQVCDRTLRGLIELGKLTHEEAVILDKMQRSMKCLPSGRWLWVGGTNWLSNAKNYSGAYNCTSTNLVDWKAFGLMMDLAMMGCGTGAVIEPRYINQLPPIRNRLHVSIRGEVGSTPKEQRRELTQIFIDGNSVIIYVGDSREGWVKSYQSILELSTDERFTDDVQIVVDISDVRQSGETLKGFGGMANPVKLPGLYQRCASILNKAIGRQLNSVECCLLIDEAAVTIVAGNIRRSAGMRQFVSEDEQGATAKDNLWQQDAEGNWRIDPERDSLRMANHTRVFHRKPTLEESIAAVRKQYYSGEGAIQWAGEAVARANADLLNTPERKRDFLQAYEQGKAKAWIQERHPNIDEQELEHRLDRYGLNPCHAGDTLVSTNQGLVPIKELVGKPFQALIDLRAVGLDGVRLTDAIAFSTGVQTTYLITLANGQQMRCTADHQHFTNHGWVATKDLTSDHHIYIQKGAGYFGEGTITVEQAQMLGWLYGDGSIYKGYKGLNAVFYINQNEYETAFPALTAAVESLIGYSHKPSLVKSVYTFHSGSPFMDSFFNKLGVKSKDYLPDQFLSQSQEVIIGFLQGIFSADGCVNVKGRSIELRNRSRQLLAQIQIILLNLGIKSSLLIKEKPGSRGVPYTLKDGNEKVSQNRGSWRLIIYSGAEARKFWQLIGFPLTPDQQERLATLATKELSRKYSEAIISQRFSSKVKSIEEFGEEPVYDLHVPLTHSFIANGCITHNCGEIIGANFHCNLAEIHLNQLDPDNYKEQEEAFKAGALSVATLLNHHFQEPRYQYSRELDPIVGVSFTGLFDFFVHAFGVDWLRWWEQGRPETEEGLIFKRGEQKYLSRWREIVHQAVWEYCDKHGIKRPNRCTTVQPAGTKSLLSGASPGWHPPKAQRFIRRITFRKNDPVALACIEYGYNVIPSQSDKDENGNLLNDPFDPRCTEWLVEIPVAVSWADLPGADVIDVSKFSVLAQLDFVMQVQKFYTRHNCFHRDTRFITRHGIFSFNDFEPGDKVEVINANGNWSVATVVCTSSPRTMYRITLQRASDIHEERLVQIISTEDHRWQTLRRTGGRLVEEVTLTQDLTLEHKIPDILLSYLPNLDVSGIQHGIVLGDGTRRKDTGSCQVYLCGEKRELGRYFPRRMERDDINQTRVTLLPSYYKELPSIDADESYLYGFIAGLLATDGNVCGTCISLSTGRADVVDWLKQVCPKLGLVISSIYIQKPSGYENSKGAYSVRFICSSVHDSLILRDFHRQKLKPSCFSKKWKVLSVEKLDFQEYGWCVMEPETNQFALEHNILTYNTSATLELRSEEVEILGTRIYEAIQKDEGYISAALLARFDDIQTFPRLPFEPIDKQTYERLSREVKIRRKTDDFCGALSRYDLGELLESGPSGCDSDKCMFPSQLITP